MPYLRPITKQTHWVIPSLECIIKASFPGSLQTRQVAIEGKLTPLIPMVCHIPQHQIAVQLLKGIMCIKRRSANAHVRGIMGVVPIAGRFHHPLVLLDPRPSLPIWAILHALHGGWSQSLRANQHRVVCFHRPLLLCPWIACDCSLQCNPGHYLSATNSLTVLSP